MEKTEEIVFRAFDPERLRIIIEKGTDRTAEYVSSYDNPEIIYAGPLFKALEYAEKYLREKRIACIAVYDLEKLESVDFYSYKPKKPYSFKDSLIGCVCFEKI